MRNGYTSDQNIPNVLIVDDIPSNLRILSDILEGSGYKVRPVLNGTYALQVAEREKPDLILLDVMIPDIDGFEVCRRLHAHPTLHDVPVIFISALSDTNDIVKAFRSGGVDYITKPFQAEEVTARVATHLKLYLQSKELQELNETLEQRVAERTKQLEAKNKELSFHLMEIEQFTFIAAHDLQEPLLTLTNFTQLIQEEYAGKLDEDGNKSIEFIYNSANRMKKLLQGLLEYSLLGKERVLTMIDCNKIVDEVLSDMADLIKVSHATINVQELPKINSFAAELRLLFLYLINNAIKFQKKENCPEINISAENRDREWIFAIADNGIGIHDKDKDKIFNIFKQMHNRNEYEGTGIGLSFCKKIVELHGGKIWVESEKDKGSTFKFSIPV